MLCKELVQQRSLKLVKLFYTTRVFLPMIMQHTGLSLDEVLKKLSTEDLTVLRDAYAKFNNTDKERKAVVKNAKDECEISLS